MQRYRLTPEVMEVFVSETGASERLSAMESEGLIRRPDAFTACRTKRYSATPKGAAFVGAKLPKGPQLYAAQNHDYFARMLALCQGIMEDVSGEAIWITQRELGDDKIRASLEKRLGRKLPGVTRAPKGYLATPEALVVSTMHDIVAAVGLELSQISNKRLEIYKTIMDDFSSDPCLDRAYLFFTDRHSMDQVGQLVRQVRDLDIRSIALPPLGCGYGGLDWDEVRVLIDEASDRLPEVKFLVYEPQERADPDN